MISKIQFDLGEDTRPVVLADIAFSDDVRDKIAKGFQDSFGTISSFCLINFRHVGRDTHQLIEIEPVKGDLDSLLKLKTILDERISIARELEQAPMKGF